VFEYVCFLLLIGIIYLFCLDTVRTSSCLKGTKAAAQGSIFNFIVKSVRLFEMFDYLECLLSEIVDNTDNEITEFRASCLTPSIVSQMIIS